MKPNALLPIAFLVVTSPVWLPFTLALVGSFSPAGPGPLVDGLGDMARQDTALQQFAWHWWRDGSAGLSANEAYGAAVSLVRLSANLGGISALLLLLLVLLAYLLSRPYNWLRPADWPVANLPLFWSESPYEPDHVEHLRWQPDTRCAKMKCPDSI